MRLADFRCENFMTCPRPLSSHVRMHEALVTADLQLVLLAIAYHEIFIQFFRGIGAARSSRSGGRWTNNLAVNYPHSHTFLHSSHNQDSLYN